MEKLVFAIHRARHYDLTPEQESVPFVSRGNRSFPARVEPPRRKNYSMAYSLTGDHHSMDRFVPVISN